MLAAHERAMTEQHDSDQDETEVTEAAKQDDGDAGEDKDEKQDDDGDEDEDDEDDDEKKSDKPKKVKINYEATMPRDEAVSYFEAIVGGLRSGRLEFKQDGDSLILSPPDQLEIEVKAQSKGDKAKIVFEIAWSDRQALKISN